MAFYLLILDIMTFKKHFFLFIGLIQASLISAQTPINGAQMEGQISQNTFEKVNVIGIYPNPATEYIMVEIKESALQDAHFILTSMIGNKIEITPEEIGKDKFRIELDGYPAGFYFLVIEDDPSRFKKAFRFLIK